jgi:HPr kinase/phosphorylase
MTGPDLPATIHGTVVALAGQGVLLRGASGAGKSDLALRLIDGGAQLVADDRVVLTAESGRLWAAPPPALAGMIEARGVGLLMLPYLTTAPLCLVVDLVAPEAVERLPEPATVLLDGHALRHLALAPFDASTPAKIRFALMARVVDALSDSAGSAAPLEYKGAP